jgi:phage shock protein A
MGQEAKAIENAAVAEALTSNLVNLEANLEELSLALPDALEASNAAKDAVATSEAALRARIAEAQKLRGQLEAAKMQERINEAVSSLGGLNSGTSVDITKLRADIERRHAEALSAAAGQSLGAAGSLVRSQKAAMDASATSRVAALRRSMGLDQLDERDEPTFEPSSLDLSERPTRPRRPDLA